MNWLIFTLAGELLSSLSTILRRVIMKDDRSDALASVVFFQFIGFVIVCVFAVLNHAPLPGVAAHPLNFLAQAILWGTSSYFLFKATKHLGAAEVSIIATFASIVTIVSAVFFLHEVFTLARVAGTVLIIAAVILISFQSQKMKLNIGVVYVLLYCLAAGIAVTNDTFLLKENSVFSLLTIGWLTPGIFLLLIQPKALGKMRYFFRIDRFWKIFLMTFVYALGGILFYAAISGGGQASQVNTISQSGIILTTFMAALFLGERDHLGKKFFAAIMVAAGVILLS